MGLVKWRSSYETGIASMDDQHKQLIELINKLYDRLKDQNSGTSTKDILNDMENYAALHFKTEEDLLNKYDYPDRQEQQEDHATYSATIKTMLASMNAENLSEKEMASRLYKYLRGWWLDHIVSLDQKYGPYLRDKGAQ